MRNRILDYSTRYDRPRRVPARGGAKPRLAELTHTLAQTIYDHPAAALGAALTIGVFVGWLIKRR